MELARDGLLIGASAVAGAINAVAGGGTLVSFPAAIAWGLPSTIANATNAVALGPGSLASAWGYRRELGGDRRALAVLSVPAVVGAVAGAAILQHTSQRLFDAVIPWLVLGATLLILFQGLIVRRAPAGDRPPSARRTALAVGCQLFVGVYGGYFGAAMGIVMLAFLSLLVPGDMHRKNAIKNLLAVMVNGVASIYFVAAGLVNGRAALIMMGGAVAGGFIGARLARRVSARAVRVLVVVIGLVLTALLAYRAYARGGAAGAVGAAPATAVAAAPATASGSTPAWVARLNAAGASAASWGASRDEVRTRILVAAGLWPPFERPPVRAVVFGRVARDGYTVENVQLETWPGFWLTGNLYRPAGAGAESAGGGARRPAVLSPHGHWKEGRFNDDDKASVPGRAITLARLGFVVLSPDMLGFGDLSSTPHRLPEAETEEARAWGPGLFGAQLWNNLRALDWLAALPEVDGARIGVTGGSSGGLQAVVLAAVDARVAAVAPVSMIGAGFQGGCPCENPPGLRIGLTNAEIAAAAAPRPLLLGASTGDWTRDAPAELGPPLGRLYTAVGAGDRFAVFQVDGPHNYAREAREHVYAWMARWLAHGAAGAERIAEPAFTVEPRAALAAVTAQHPLPPGALDARGLLASMRAAAAAQVDATPPPDAALMARGLRAVFAAEAGTGTGAGAGTTTNTNATTTRSTSTSTSTTTSTSRREGILVVAMRAEEAAPLAGALRGRGARLVEVILAPHARELPDAGIPKHQALYPDTYFRRPLAWQVRDTLEAIDALAAEPGVAEVRVAGVGAAGPAALFARALARSPKLTGAIVDLRAPAPEVASYPGLARLGGLATAARLVTPAPTLIRAGETWDDGAVARALVARPSP